MKKILVTAFSVLVIMGMTAGSASAATVNMSTDNWYKFIFGEVGSSSSDNYVFTVNSGYSLFVTDAYQVGDRFQVGDLGSTSFKETDATYYYSPYGEQTSAQAAYDSGYYSTGEFILGAGSYDVTLTTLLSPFGGGGAYIKLATSSTAVPEPMTMLLFAMGLIGLAGLKRKIS